VAIAAQRGAADEEQRLRADPGGKVLIERFVAVGTAPGFKLVN
jgi:hypothetical protein